MKPTESAVKKTRSEVQSSYFPCYLWEFPQKPVSVRIPFSLIDQLEREAVENFRSLTSRGSEIGGLLVGDVSPGSPLVVSITDYDLVACDYSRGPLYRLNDADMGRFEHAIQQRLAAGRGGAGFFRSHTRKGISLDVDDLAFFQGRFRDPHHVALLIRPFATKPSTAGIFTWENGKVNGDASYLEFPFRSSELGPGHSPLVPEPNAAAPVAPPPPAPKGNVRAQIVPIASRREIPPGSPVSDAKATIPVTGHLVSALNQNLERTQTIPAEHHPSSPDDLGLLQAPEEPPPDKEMLLVGKLSRIQKLAVLIAERAGWLTMYDDDIVRRFLRPA